MALGVSKAGSAACGLTGAFRVEARLRQRIDAVSTHVDRFDG